MVPDLKFCLFPLVTAKTWCGGLCLFGQNGIVPQSCHYYIWKLLSSVQSPKKRWYFVFTSLSMAQICLYHLSPEDTLCLMMTKRCRGWWKKLLESYLEDQGSQNLSTRGCHDHCCKWLWQISYLLDASTICEAWDCCACNILQLIVVHSIMSMMLAA